MRESSSNASRRSQTAHETAVSHRHHLGGDRRHRGLRLGAAQGDGRRGGSDHPPSRRRRGQHRPGGTAHGAGQGLHLCAGGERRHIVGRPICRGTVPGSARRCRETARRGRRGPAREGPGDRRLPGSLPIAVAEPHRSLQAGAAHPEPRTRHGADCRRPRHDEQGRQAPLRYRARPRQVRRRHGADEQRHHRRQHTAGRCAPDPVGRVLLRAARRRPPRHRRRGGFHLLAVDPESVDATRPPLGHDAAPRGGRPRRRRGGRGQA